VVSSSAISRITLTKGAVVVFGKSDELSPDMVKRYLTV
jgi:hypothetical protein